ncbi:hypothetical protein JCM3775_002446 [Rhodotorula graminis]
MDLDALRKAALSSKKRRRTPPPDAPDPDEREEGEIDDDQPDPFTAPEPPYYHQHDHDHYYDPHYAPHHSLVDHGRPSSSSASLTAVKEETKRVIAELLTWGVSPDYLLSIGISRDALESSFYELGLDISIPPAHAPPFAPYSPLPSTSTSLSAHARPFTPTPRTSTSPAPSADLAALEALKRQQLFARKAALTARNAQSAQSFESALDDLFSASATASTSADPDSSTAEASTTPSTVAAKKKARKRANKKRKLSEAAAAPDDDHRHDSTSPAQRTHDLRDAIDHTEELVDVPAGGPFAASTSSTSPASRSIAAASTRPSSTFSNRHAHVGAPASGSGSSSNLRTRPLATDFEAEPATRLAGPGGSGHGGGIGRGGMYAAGVSGTGFLPRLATLGAGEGSMVIDLSDSEDDEGEDGGGGSSSRVEGGRGGVRDGLDVPSGGGSKAPSPAPPVVDAAEVERKRRLEEKEHEIERMMVRIAEMERKKQALRDKKGAAERQGDKVTPEVEVAAAAVEVTGQAEQGQMVEREGEDVAREDEVRESALASEEEAPLRVEVDEAGAASSTEVFRPYASSLARFPLIRASAAGPDSASSSSSAAEGTGNAGLASWVARKHGVDTSKRLCKAEAGGGTCHDAKCRSVHVASFEPTAAELAEYQSLRPSSQLQSTTATPTADLADHADAHAA